MYLIGFSGKKQAGKDTGAHYLGGWYQEQNHPPYLPARTRYLSLADPLKRFCRNWFALEGASVLGDDEAKNKLTQHRWENLPASVSNGRVGFMTGREILQIWGSDILRGFWPDIHCHQLRVAVNNAQEDGIGLALITDVRFPNEVDTVLDLGGTIIRLTRNPYPTDAHQSETALDSKDWTNTPRCHVLDNSAFTLDEYRTAVIELGRQIIETQQKASV